VGPFTLQFEPSELRPLAARFPTQDDSEADRIGADARRRGFLTKPELERVVEWKSGGRQRRNAARNSSEGVEEITGVALAARDERLRVGALLCLEGVSWPTASVVLHFAHPDPYPIIEYRALEALGVNRAGPYTFAFWLAYVEACRGLAREYGLTMRELDRALWQWSKERASDRRDDARAGRANPQGAA
jgi:hypothetical protein